MDNIENDQRKTLIGLDYLNMPLSELMLHDDFSPHAMRVVNAVLEMPTSKLEELDLLGGNKNG